MGSFIDRLVADMKARPANTNLYLSGFGVKGNGSDETEKVQLAFDTARQANKMLVCDVAGTIGISHAVSIGATTPNSAQRTLAHLSGKLSLQALAPTESMFIQQGTVGWADLELELDGSDKAMFGVYGRDCGRSRVGYVHARNCPTSALAIEPTGNNNLMSIRRIRAWSTGSSHKTQGTVASHSASGGWTGLSATPTTSRWNLAVPLPPAMRPKTWASCVAVMADGRVSSVTGLDTAGGTWVDIAHENRAVGYSESITIYTAAVAMPYHGDTGAWRISETDIRQCASAATMNIGGYGGHIDSHTQQANALGVVIPIRAIGFDVGHWYTEGIETMLYACHVNHNVVGTQVTIGAGNKANAKIQVADQDWMSMTKRGNLPPHWRIAREYPDPGFVVPPAAPIDPPETNPGTRNLTPGTVQAYSYTSANPALRIANTTNRSGVGVVTLVAPPTGNGVTATISLLSANGDTIMGASTWTRKLSATESIELVYWLEGTTWKITVKGDTAALSQNVNTLTGKVATLETNTTPDGLYSTVSQKLVADTTLTGDWASSREQDIEARTFLNDTPVSISFAATMQPTTTDMVLYRISKCGTETKTTGWNGADDPNFAFGFSNSSLSTNQGWAQDLVLATGYKPGGDAQAASWPFIMSWRMTGDAFDIVGYGNRYDYASMLMVNGRFVDAAPINSGLPVGEWRMSVRFRSNATRTITMWLPRGSVNAVYVAAGATITKPSFTGPKIAIIGDSYVNGAGDSADFPNQGTSIFETFGIRFARAFDTSAIPVLAGIGGTGWLAGGELSSFRTRVPAVLSTNPDLLVFSGSINDDTFGTTELRTAMSQTLALCASVPKVMVLWTPSSDSDYWFRIRDALRTETLAAGRQFFDLTGVLRGTGRIGVPAGDGTNDYYRMTDGAHPTLAGHKAMFRRLLALYAKTI